MGLLTKYTKIFTKTEWWVKILVISALIYIVYYMGWLGTLNVESFEGEESTKQSRAFVCTMYQTEWCGYCKKAKPEWSQITDEYHNKTINGTTISILSVDCDKNPELAKAENVDGYPTFKFKLDGKEVAFNGERTYNEFKKFIDGIVN